METVQQTPEKDVPLKSIYIDGDVHRQAKIRSAEQGKSIREYVEEALKLMEEEQQIAANG